MEKYNRNKMINIDRILTSIANKLYLLTTSAKKIKPQRLFIKIKLMVAANKY